MEPTLVRLALHPIAAFIAWDQGVSQPRRRRRWVFRGYTV
jgi:hypothetical protein